MSTYPEYRVSVFMENGWNYATYYALHWAHAWYDMSRKHGYLCMLVKMKAKSIQPQD